MDDLKLMPINMRPSIDVGTYITKIMISLTIASLRTQDDVNITIITYV